MKNLEILSNAIDFIEINITEKISTEDVANACFCSKSYLQKIFRYVNEYSIKEYVKKRRLTNAARELLEYQEKTILHIAFAYGYSSSEAFTRAFEQVWNCSPSTFRKQSKFSQLYPRHWIERENGENRMSQKRKLDISELYHLFCQRRDCYFVCCDIKSFGDINKISYKAGDLAILEVLSRMEENSLEEDIVFRIGGDEFVILTNHKDIEYANKIANTIQEKNGVPISFEGEKIPVNIYVSVTKLENQVIKYNELFHTLHEVIISSK